MLPLAMAFTMLGGSLHREQNRPWDQGNDDVDALCGCCLIYVGRVWYSYTIIPMCTYCIFVTISIGKKSYCAELFAWTG